MCLEILRKTKARQEEFHCHGKHLKPGHESERVSLQHPLLRSTHILLTLLTFRFISSKTLIGTRQTTHSENFRSQNELWERGLVMYVRRRHLNYLDMEIYNLARYRLTSQNFIQSSVRYSINYS